MIAGVLASQACSDPKLSGGKASALARLVVAGFDVPPFLVLGDDAFEGDGTVIRQDVLKVLPDSLAALGAGPFAVRSSARSEDGAQASHAGQFDTILNVGPEEVAQAAHQVRVSGLADHVAHYRADHGLDSVELPLVLVQVMVPASAAGVAFSADPVGGRRDIAVVSAVEGLGDVLVNGEVDGENWAVGADGDIVSGPDQTGVLSGDQAVAIAGLARRLEAEFGCAQDIEWALEGKRLRLLQARPVTTELRPRPSSDDALVVLDNSNIVESYPGLVSPLTYSFAVYSYDRVYRAFVSLLRLDKATISENGDVFANLLARIDGRVYYNLGNWYRALALLPAFSLNSGYMETMMGVGSPLPGELTDRLAPKQARGFRRLVEYLRLGRIGAGLMLEAIRLTRTKAAFYDRLERSLKTGPDPATANLTELAKSYRRIESELLDNWDAPLINDFLCMIGFGASRAVLEKWAGPKGLEFHNDVMIGQGGIISAEPARQIASMGRLAREDDACLAALQDGSVSAIADFPALAQAVKVYLAQFGDRCTEELKLESLPLSEDPAPLLAAIHSAARRGDVTSEREPTADWQALLPGKPVRRWFARKLTMWAAARVRDRENLRFERTRIFAHARRVFLAMGREFFARGILDAPRDVLHLTVPEILGAIEGNCLTPVLKPMVELRKAEAKANEARPAPPERILLRGPVAGHRPARSCEPQDAGGDERVGTACSKGTVTAPARVVSDPRTEMLQPGEILVASNTDPGWIALFSGAAAIVVERGSLLSHSAIVSREMGIPCVVGIRDATRWLQTGDLIEVDGATGHVRKVDG